MRRALARAAMAAGPQQQQGCFQGVSLRLQSPGEALLQTLGEGLWREDRQSLVAAC
jgi:hypothetical protein